MVFLMTALVGLIALEAVCIVVTGSVNNELVAAISGLVGGLVTAFLLGRK
jgi:membrane associated rhomboid family serine protease